MIQRRNEEKKAKKIYEARKQRRQRKQTGNVPVVIGPNGEPLTQEELLTPSFLRKQHRKVIAYFDQNDEMVEEQVAISDPNNYYHKYHMVEMDFKPAYEDDDEDEEEIQLLEEIIGKASTRKGDKQGKKTNARSKIDQITKDSFYGEKPSDNAEIFINTLQKTRVKHFKKVQDRELFLAGATINNNDVYRPISDDEHPSDLDEETTVSGAPTYTNK